MAPRLSDSIGIRKGAGFVTFPHAHIGAAMVSREAPVRPRDFHRAHIPTRSITLEEIVSFAITELGVEPLRADWQAILAKSAE